MGTLAAPRQIPISESLLRREAVENAIADLRLEGLTPTCKAATLFERYVSGELSEQDLLDAILAR